MDNATATNRYLKFSESTANGGRTHLVSIESILTAGFPFGEDDEEMELESQDLLDCDGNPT